MMSKAAAMLNLLADALENGTLGGCDLRMIARTLEAVPEEYHEDAVRAALSADKAEDEAPEDYAVVKTFDSTDFHVGDEVCSDIRKYVVCGIENGVIRVFGNGGVYAFDPRFANGYYRTGRNFPAIAAILAEIGK